MSEEERKRLLAAAEFGALDDVRAAFEACDDYERKKYGHEALQCAVEIPSFSTLEIVKFLMEQGVKPDSSTLFYAAKNYGPCAFEIVKLITESKTGPHEKDRYGDTAFTLVLRNRKLAIADYLLFHDDFFLSDLMPRPKLFPTDIYNSYRGKAISRVSEVIDAKGIEYAKIVAVDIEKILTIKYSEPPTQEDFDVLQPLVQKIASKDWVSEAQVSSYDFLGCDVER